MVKTSDRKIFFPFISKWLGREMGFLGPKCWRFTFINNAKTSVNIGCPRSAYIKQNIRNVRESWARSARAILVASKQRQVTGPQSLEIGASKQTQVTGPQSLEIGEKNWILENSTNIVMIFIIKIGVLETTRRVVGTTITMI